jgi:hypothetical protein
VQRILWALLVATLPCGSVLAEAPQSKNATVTLVYQHELPHVPGKSLKGVLVAYGPGGSSPGHTHPQSAGRHRALSTEPLSVCNTESLRLPVPRRGADAAPVPSLLSAETGWTYAISPPAQWTLELPVPYAGLYGAAQASAAGRYTWRVP